MIKNHKQKNGKNKGIKFQHTKKQKHSEIKQKTTKTLKKQEIFLRRHCPGYIRNCKCCVGVKNGGDFM